MRVIIYFEDGVEFDHMYQEYFGTRPQLIRDWSVNRAPGVATRAGLFEVEDDSAMATWIRMARPQWIDYPWMETKNDT